MLTIQAPKAGATPIKKTLSKTELNAIDARMLLAIVNHDNPGFDVTLSDGANVNAIGVIWEYEDAPSTDSPLNFAVTCGNLYAVKKLIHGGASLYADNKIGRSPVGEAVLKGEDKIVQALLNEDPSQVNEITEDTDHTLLHRALFKISSYSVIADGDWGSPALKGKAEDFYREKIGSMPSVPSVVTYTGNLDLVNVLLRFNPKLATTQDASGVTPLDIVTNPSKFVAEFFDCNGDETIKCLTPASDANDHILTFNVTLSDRCRNNPFTVNVRFDFTKLKQRLSEVSDVRVELAEQRLKYESDRINRVNQQVQTHSWQIYTNTQAIQSLAVSLQPVIQKYHTDAEWLHIKNVIAENRLAECFRFTLKSKLVETLNAIRVLASEKIQRNAGAGESIATAILNGLGTTGTPLLGAVFSLSAVAITKIFDWKEGKFNKTVSRLFTDVELEDFSDKLSIDIIGYFMPLFKGTTITKEAEQHAERAGEKMFAFVLGILGSGVISLEKNKHLSPAQNIREQVGAFLTESELSRKHKEQFITYIVRIEQEQRPILFSGSAQLASNGKTVFQPTLANGEGYGTQSPIQQPYANSSGVDHSTNGFTNVNGDKNPNPLSSPSVSKQKKQRCIVM